jgi:hypothetical protein
MLEVVGQHRRPGKRLKDVPMGSHGREKSDNEEQVAKPSEHSSTLAPRLGRVNSLLPKPEQFN